MNTPDGDLMNEGWGLVAAAQNGNSSKTRLIWKQTRVHSKLLISRNQTTDQAGIILQTTPNYVGVIWKPGSGLNS